MQWDDVRILLALLRSESLVQAAAQLGVNRSTISRRIAELEASLGARLFSRTRDGMQPTAAAQRLRPHAERIESEMVALGSTATVGAAQAVGNVRIATTEGFAAYLIEEGLLGVTDNDPGLAIEVLAGNRPLDLLRGEADIAVRLAELRQATLRVRCLSRLGLGLFASPDYLRSRGTPRSARALAGHDILTATGELARLPENRWLAARKGTLVAFRSNSMPALIAAAEAGRGIMALGLGWAARFSGLQRILVLDQVPPRPVWLVTREADARNAAVQTVSRAIAAIFQRAVRS